MAQAVDTVVILAGPAGLSVTGVMDDGVPDKGRSALLVGVGEDAGHVAGALSDRAAG